MSIEIKYAIRDNDGVNIDSEDVAMRVMDDWGVKFITQFNQDSAALLEKNYIYNTYPGTSTNKIINALIEKHNLSPELIRAVHNIAEDIDIGLHLAENVTRETNESFRKLPLKAIPGAAESLRENQAMLGAENTALATTSPPHRMDVSVKYAVDPVTGENAGFETLYPEGSRRFSGYDSKNKYDAFFAQSGWDPAKSVITEDSIPGVGYAKAGRPHTHVIGTVAAKFYTDKEAHAAALLKAGANIVISTMYDENKAIRWMQTGFDPAQKPDFMGDVFLPETKAPDAAPAPPGLG